MSFPALPFRVNFQGKPFRPVRQSFSAGGSFMRRRTLPKLVFIFLLLAFSFSLLAGSAHAQTSTTTTVGSGSSQGDQSSNSYNTPNLNPDVPQDQHSYVQSVTIELLSSIVCQLAGFDPIRKDQKCLGIDQQTGKIGFVENSGGAIGLMGHFIAMTYTPPASTSDYVRYMAGNFGIAKKTYANNHQSISECAASKGGVGICGIKPLVQVWVAMRNIAYLLFVVIFVIIGLAIMLRVHIDPRTVMTIENQIPKIIVGILLVTFSFAIAGLLIDVMYVAIYLVSGVLFNAYPLPEGIKLNDIVTSPTPFDAINRLWPGDKGAGGSGGGFVELSNQGKNTIEALITSVLGGKNPINYSPGLFDLIGNLFGSVVGLIFGILAFVVVLLGLIYTSVRLWFILVLSYINILLDVVFAPFWILIGLLPGSSAGIGGWLKDMLANLSVYPTALAMLILGKIFSEIAYRATDTDGIFFTPPLAGGGFNQGGDGNTAFAGIIALGFLFMTPHVLTITRGAIKAPNINYGPVFQMPGAGAKAAAGTIKEMGATTLASKELIPTKGGGPWEERRVGKAFLGRVFGR